MIEIVKSKIIDEAYSYLKKLISENFKFLIIRKSDIVSSLESHLKYVDLWSKYVFFNDMPESKTLKNTYINLNISLIPKKFEAKDNPSIRKDILSILKTDKHIVLLGDPGAGKTTTLKFLCQNILFEDIPSLTNFNFPIVVTLRSLGDSELLYDKLKSILGIYLVSNNKALSASEVEKKDRKEILTKAINQYLDNLGALILIDGLDEVNPNKIKDITSEIRELVLNLKYSKVIITSRSGAFHINIINTSVYELCPLSLIQTKKFCSKWFKDKQKRISFLNELEKSPLKDTADRPLILALLCSLYSKYLRLPDKPKYIYNRITRLLVDEWDAQRDIKRVSNHKNIQNENIFDFLIHFAFELSLNFEQKSYSMDDIEYILNESMSSYDINQSLIRSFLFDIETRNGIFVKSSYDTFEFSHKSLQEYLTAEYIVRLPDIPSEIIECYNLYNELAISVCLSSNSTLYFCNLVLNIMGEAPRNYDAKQMVSIFFYRLNIEKPEFESTPMLAYTILFVFHTWYLENHQYANNLGFYEEDIDSDEYNGDSFDFINMIGEILEYPSVRKSFSFLNDYIEKVQSYGFSMKSKNDFRILIYFDKSMYLRNFKGDYRHKLFSSSLIYNKLITNANS